MRSVLLAGIALGVLGCQMTGDKKVVLENQKDKLSYSIGVNIGKNMGRDSIAFNPEALLQGIKDAALDSSKRLMTDVQVQETIMAFQEEMRTKQMEQAHAQGEKNKSAGESFLAANAKRAGVVTRPSGLQYEVIAEGTGKSPRAEQTVTTNYRGTLVDGTEFDSSYKRGQPATFPVSGVIPGWTEALQLMKVGSRWKLYVPANLAYGEKGAGSIIPPNAILIFEIELLSVK